MSTIEHVAVVDVSKLRLPHRTENSLSDHYDPVRDSYHRYYPNEISAYLTPEVKAVINKALNAAGLFWPDESYYYVLLWFDW